MGKNKLGIHYLSPWCKSCHHKYVVARRYNLKRSEYDKLTEGACDICWRKEKMFIDHCHVTQRVRGALCNTCNVMLGMSRDNVTILRRAADYLDERS